MTGSSAMLSEDIHSLVDTGNQMLLLYGMKQAKKTG
ncbi:MAG: divalent metal cation (Fe/Co/Zn/Cd) transporter [Psychromonas sp.]|jgi:divalent metal cation (Fe/Co/Zn/Cd) transporter